MVLAVLKTLLTILGGMSLNVILSVIAMLIEANDLLGRYCS